MACIIRFDDARGLFGACARQMVCYSGCVGRRGWTRRFYRRGCRANLTAAYHPENSNRSEFFSRYQARPLRQQARRLWRTLH
jgi:hypothetical protein